MLVDSHCHLTDPQFEDDRHQVLKRAWDGGVVKVLSIGSTRADAEAVAALVKTQETGGRPRLWGTAGVHPHDADSAADGDLDAIQEILRTSSGMVAVGETGLDFFYDHAPRAAQEALFRDHLALAEFLDLPVVVHSRSADDLTARILREWKGRVRGVLHCFTGGQDLLDTALEVGWMISFTGLITFKNYQGARQVRSVPQDRLMVETDGPYLAPVPHRGRRNEPAYVARVAEALASIREEGLEEVHAFTSRNANRFFGLDP